MYSWILNLYLDLHLDISAHLTSSLPILQILFCSRTHTQLSQFVHEIRNSAFGKDVRVTVLGSRANLCTNPDVSKVCDAEQMYESFFFYSYLRAVQLGALWRINDACMDLQKKTDEVDPEVSTQILSRCILRSAAAALLLPDGQHHQGQGVSTAGAARHGRPARRDSGANRFGSVPPSTVLNLFPPTLYLRPSHATLRSSHSLARNAAHAPTMPRVAACRWPRSETVVV